MIGALVLDMLLLAIPSDLNAREILGLLVGGIIPAPVFASFSRSWRRPGRSEQVRHETHEIEAREA